MADQKIPVTAPPRGFDNTEYQNRLDRIQYLMATKQLAGILLTTEHDIQYFTGFHTPFWQSPTRPWFVVLPLEGKPIAVIPEIGVKCMQNGWMEDIRSWPSPHIDDDGVSLLVETLREVLNLGVGILGKGGYGIGINQGRETHIRVPWHDFKRIDNSFMNEEKSIFIDATPIIRQLRMVKSQSEIAKIGYVAQRVSGVFENLFDFVGVGMSDTEIFRAFKIECLKAGVDDVPFLVGAMGLNGYDDIISPPSGKCLLDGDVLILDTGCVYDGYYCDFDRNYGFTKIDTATQRAYEIVWQATEAGLESAKPGNRCSDLFHAMNRVMQENGALGESVGRYGHGLGLQLTEPPSHTDWDDTVLEVGMVLTIEPGMQYAPQQIMVHEENIVITETGAELLTRRAPEKMPIKT